MKPYEEAPKDDPERKERGGDGAVGRADEWWSRTRSETSIAAILRRSREEISRRDEWAVVTGEGWRSRHGRRWGA